MGRTKLERETVFGFNDEEETGWISTSSPSVHKKLTRRIGPAKELSPGSWTWDVPKNWLKLPSKKRNRVGKPLTEEHKAALLKGRKK